MGLCADQGEVKWTWMPLVMCVCNLFMGIAFFAKWYVFPRESKTIQNVMRNNNNKTNNDVRAMMQTKRPSCQTIKVFI